MLSIVLDLVNELYPPPPLKNFVFTTITLLFILPYSCLFNAGGTPQGHFCIFITSIGFLGLIPADIDLNLKMVERTESCKFQLPGVARGITSRDFFVLLFVLFSILLLRLLGSTLPFEDTFQFFKFLQGFQYCLGFLGAHQVS